MSSASPAIAGAARYGHMTTGKMPRQLEHTILHTHMVHDKWAKFLIATVRSPDGQTVEREIEDHGEAVCVLPYNAERKTAILVRQMRASFNVLGPLVARTGHAKVSLPGGCAIGARPVDLHLKALEALGASIDLHDGYVFAQAPRGLRGARIEFPFVSVGATEHTLLAAVLAEGETVIVNAACEPEIGDLIDCLTRMGAKIEGKDTSTLSIKGVSRLNGTTHAVIPDRIETGTYALAVAMAGGEVRLTRTRSDFIEALLVKMEAAGVEITRANDGLTVKRNGARLKSVDVETEAYPGFATDLQAQFMALMTMADGVSVIRETIFENRFMHAPELARLGADITVRGGEAEVRGTPQLHGAQVMATDLRASVSLVVAALAARGETVVNRVYHLDRGFERLEEKLGACGADIRRLSHDTGEE